MNSAPGKGGSGPVCPLGHPSGASSGSCAASDLVRGRSGSRGEREHGALCRNNAVSQHLDARMWEGRETVCRARRPFRTGSRLSRKNRGRVDRGSLEAALAKRNREASPVPTKPATVLPQPQPAPKRRRKALTIDQALIRPEDCGKNVFLGALCSRGMLIRAQVTVYEETRRHKIVCNVLGTQSVRNVRQRRCDAMTEL